LREHGGQHADQEAERNAADETGKEACGAWASALVFTP